MMMGNPNITMEEYNKLQAEKAQRRGRTFNWQTATYEGYTEDIVHDFEQRLDMIFGRDANRVYVLGFTGLTEETGQTLADRMRMVFIGAKGQVMFTSHAWRRLFEIRGPLLQGARRMMTWRQLIMALGLHIAKEMAEDGFEAYWLGIKMMMGNPNITMEEYIKLQAEKAQRHDFEVYYPTIVYNDASTSSKNVSSEPIRLDMIFGRDANRVYVLGFTGLTEETGQTLADRMRMVFIGAKGQVMFTSHAWRRLFEIRGPLLQGARRMMTWRQLIMALGLHIAKEMAEDGFEAYWIYSRGQAPEKVTATDLFYLRSMDQGMAWVAPRPERQSITTGSALKVVEGALDVDVGAQAVSKLVQVPQPPPVAASTRTMAQTLSILEEKVHSLRDDMGEVRQRTGEASTSAAPLDEDQPDP
nr:hypothetical protein [Tanacetum cinerariifolium]